MNGGLVVLPIVARSNREALARLEEAAAEPADLHELRLDLLEEEPAAELLVRASSRPVIATCRSRSQGGGFPGGAAERLDLLRRAGRAGAAFVDAEEDVSGGLPRGDGAVVIASWHDFSGTPGNLPDRVRELEDAPGDWIKFAVTARRPEDNLAVFDALSRCSKPAIAIAMGEMGLPSRILGPAHGSRATFGSLSRGLESAPGQPTARELAELYRVKSLTRDSAVYGLIGDPVAQSSGHIYHNRAFAMAGLDAVYIPFLCLDAKAFLREVPAAVNLRGLSVTMPHKLAALEAAEQCSDNARLAGAANTLRRRAGGGWSADNTDFAAVVEAVGGKAAALGLSLSGAPALVLGGGGAARGVGAALAKLGCRVAAAGRDGAKTAALAQAMGWDSVPWAETGRGGWRVVANATPVGMVPEIEATPFPAAGWRPGMIAFDAVHNPRLTRFLREAKAAGAEPLDGFDMFIRQARGQFKLWTGREMPPASFGPGRAGGEAKEG
ncbi:MAG: type I 3-dehydroquinate dehydratase [Planctomycetota bacterium]|jgi:3-dehydroquinate dehydratase/shikimate dehydrogenase|nr:type I 3-dehydroquinate dehydratase [Planctomycetota bacterium]